MKNMRLSVKLITGFAIVLCLTLVVGIVGIFGLTSMLKSAEAIYQEKALPLADLSKSIESFQNLRLNLRNSVIYTGLEDKLAKVDQDMEKCYTDFETAVNKYKPTMSSENARKTFDTLMDEYTTTFVPGIEKVLANAKLGMDSQDLMAQLGLLTPSGERINGYFDELMSARMDTMSASNAALEKLNRTLLLTIIAVILLAIIVGAFMALFISNLISKPINPITVFMKKAGSTGDISLTKLDEEIISKTAGQKDEIGQLIGSTAQFVKRLHDVSKTLETLAAGDLTVDLKLLSEQDVIGKSLQKVIENLNGMFSEIQSATSQVSIGSKQIADGAQTLAQGSTEQASAVQELSASISEIAQKTKKNAEMAGDAATLAFNIKENAEKGTMQMDQMMQAVREINDASQNISKVIKAIDDIAFQTNILALNAAVEAARAGQHGKGFAVVAEEVRNLAAKSAQAAKETGSLIANSIEKAEIGSRIANDTATSLGEIVSGINESNRIVDDIAKSSEEQSLGIEQINCGIDQVAQVVQQNSATAEESAAASQQMSGQADSLEELISHFKLRNSQGRIDTRHSRYSLPEKANRSTVGAYDGGMGKY